MGYRRDRHRDGKLTTPHALVRYPLKNRRHRCRLRSSPVTVAANPADDIGAPRIIVGTDGYVAGTLGNEVLMRGNEGSSQGKEGSPRGNEGSPREDEGSSRGNDGSPRGNEGSPWGNDVYPAGNVVGEGANDVSVEGSLNGVRRPLTERNNKHEADTRFATARGSRTARPPPPPCHRGVACRDATRSVRSVDIRLFGPDAVMLPPEAIPDLVQQTGFVRHPYRPPKVCLRLGFRGYYNPLKCLILGRGTFVY